MARTDTLPHFLTDVADAIRTKSGTSETIQASSFDTAIANIPSGGSLNVGKATVTVVYNTAGFDEDITFTDILGEPKMYFFTFNHDEYSGTTADNFVASLTSNFTMSQYWDGQSENVYSLNATLRNGSSSSVVINWYKEQKSVGTYDATNHTFTVHGITVPYQKSGSYVTKPYGLVYFY